MANVLAQASQGQPPAPAFAAFLRSAGGVVHQRTSSTVFSWRRTGLEGGAPWLKRRTKANQNSLCP